MSQRTDWLTLSISIASGIGVGLLVAVGGVAAGIPTVAVALISGVVVAGLVPLIYRWRSKGQEGNT
jgi:uncharacterized membrane protein SpoIIM required for sporulation